MKCSQCDFYNSADARFCENCGDRLEDQEASAQKERTASDFATETPIHKNDEPKSRYAEYFEEAIDDNIFPHANKSNSGSSWGRALVTIVGIGLLFLLVLWVFAEDSEYSSSDTAPTQLEDTSSQFRLSMLELDNLDSKYVGQTYYLTGTVLNNSSEFLQDVFLRADFFRNEDQTGLFDTRYISIEALPPNGAFSFEEPMYISPPTDSWWWVLSVDDATVVE